MLTVIVFEDGVVVSAFVVVDAKVLTTMLVVVVDGVVMTKVAAVGVLAEVGAGLIEAPLIMSSVVVPGW